MIDAETGGVCLCFRTIPMWLYEHKSLSFVKEHGILHGFLLRNRQLIWEKHLPTRTSPYLRELYFTPRSKDLIAANGKDKAAVRLCRLLFLSLNSVNFKAIYRDGGTTATVWRQSWLPVPVRPTCVGWLSTTPPKPTQTLSIRLASAGWRLLSSPTLLLSAVFLPTRCAHSNLYSTFRLQTCSVWSLVIGAAFGGCVETGNKLDQVF